MFWSDPSGLSATSSEFTHDFMGRARFDKYGMFIPPFERQYKSITTDGGNGEGSGGGGSQLMSLLKALSNIAGTDVTWTNKNGSWHSDTGLILRPSGNGWILWEPFSSVEELTDSGSELGGVISGMRKIFISIDAGGRAGDIPWMTTAISQVGIREATGNNDGTDVEKYLKSGGLGKGYPWCGSFVNWTLNNSGINVSGVRGNPNLALNWRGFGTKLDKPAYGAIATKSRNGGGHVGFVAGITSNGGIVLLGGNQNDSVNYTVYSPGTVFHYNFPIGFTPNFNLPTLNISGGTIKEN